MAKNEQLYKRLHEEYNLNVNEDFWKHKQSGSWIISHNAVKRLLHSKQARDF